MPRILICHVLPANAQCDVIMGIADEAGGTFQVTTLVGCVLDVTANRQSVTLSDENGLIENVFVADVRQSNGVFRVIGREILPAQ